MLQVIPSRCKSDGNEGVVVVESDLSDLPAAIEEAGGPQARSLALAHAGQLQPPIPNAGVNTESGAYAVDAQGEAIPLEKFGTIPIHAYRNDIQIRVRL